MNNLMKTASTKYPASVIVWDCMSANGIGRIKFQESNIVMMHLVTTVIQKG